MWHSNKTINSAGTHSGFLMNRAAVLSASCQLIVNFFLFLSKVLSVCLDSLILSSLSFCVCTDCLEFFLWDLFNLFSDYLCRLNSKIYFWRWWCCILTIFGCSWL